MLSTFACPGCGQTLKVRADEDARAVRCPFCETPVRILPPAPPVEANTTNRPLWLVLGGILLLGALIGGAGALYAQFQRNQPESYPLMVVPSPERRILAPGGGGGPGGIGGPGGPGGPRGMMRIPSPSEPELISLNDGIEVVLTANGQTNPGWSQTGRLPSCLAVTLAATPGWLFTSDRHGGLSWFDRTSFRQLGKARLLQPAYQLALDVRRGLLYTASSHPDILHLGPLGDRDAALGDVHIYDVAALLRGAAPARLEPVATVALDAHISSFLLSPDGEHLYVVAESTRGTQIARIDTQKREKVHALYIRGAGPLALSLAPDARMLYALAAGRVVALDPDQWRIQETISVGGTIFGLVAAAQRRVILIERRLRTQMLILDVPSKRVVSRWRTSLDGRVYAHVSSDGKRFFLGTSALTTGQLFALDITGERILRPTIVKHTQGNGERLLRGPIFLAPDSSAILTASGQVFPIAS